MSKDYFRFDPVGEFGIVNSTLGNAVYQESSAKHVVVPALESLLVWNMRTGQQVSSWKDPECHALASFIIECHNDLYAVGYEDGSIRLFNSKTASLMITLSGHSSGITALCFDAASGKLASGSKDCDIVIWDISSETGLYRLKGHTNAITGLCFMDSGKVLVSSSKDTLLKIWDLASQHCVDTMVAHHTEITCLIAEADLLYTATAERTLRCIKVDLEKFHKNLVSSKQDDMKLENGSRDDSLGVFELVEYIDRSTKERALWMALKQNYLVVSSNDRTLELFKINKKNDSSKKHVHLLRSCKLSSKARAVCFSLDWKIKSQKSIKLLVTLNSNTVQEVILPLDAAEDLRIDASLDHLGHRSEVRLVKVSNDGKLVLSASDESMKLWNVNTGNCIRTIVTDVAVLSGIFTPSDSEVVLGLQSGAIYYYDLNTGDLIDSIQAHEAAINSIEIAPDGKGFITGSADKSIKFWEFKRKKEGKARIKHIKTLQIGEAVLCVRYSPDQRLIAIALLDMTVKVFYEDSLKFFLSLYGHKLPVTSMSISSDSSIIATGSADKSIKVWSLQFGDCRRSLFAHTEAVTSIQFIPGHKHLVSAGKDSLVKYWDLETFEQLQKLSGHHGTVWSISYGGQGIVVSASQDRSIRVWRQDERGGELLFPQEEKEKEVDEQIDQSLLEANPFEKDAVIQAETGPASKQTLASMKAGERLVEALEAADTERTKLNQRDLAKQHGQDLELPSREPLFLAVGGDKTPAELVLWAFEQIPLPELEEALLSIPLARLKSILFYLNEWLGHRLSLTMSSRVLSKLIKIWYNYICADASLLGLLESIEKAQDGQIQEFKELMEGNIGAIRYHNNSIVW